MNMSQQRFFLIMQKLEVIETAITVSRKAVDELSTAVKKIETTTDGNHYRLLLAGLALSLELGGISAENRKKYNRGDIV